MADAGFGSYLSLAAMAALSAVFAASTWGKVRSGGALRSFVDSLRPLLPARLTGPVGVGLAVVEGGTAFGLMGSIAATTRHWTGARTGALLCLTAAGLLLVLLTAGVVVALRRKVGARCACFGSTQRPLSRRHLVRNALLLALAVTALPGVRTAGGVALPGAVTAVVAGAVVAAVVIHLDDVVELFAPMGPASRSAAASGEDA